MQARRAVRVVGGGLWPRLWLALGGWALGGCASGDEPRVTGIAFDGSQATSAGGTSAATGPGPADDSADGSWDSATDGVEPPDLGTCTVDADCVVGADSCFQPLGTCEGGSCQHLPRGAGTPCNDGVACTGGDVCNGMGACVGALLECSAPHAEGGRCADGTCTDLTCSAGWDDCNDDLGATPTDGCETELGTATDCTACGEVCNAGDNATGSCGAGRCEYECTGAWDNCDGDWDNGCEIPVGVPHQCDQTGLNPTTGCWTAYCGASADPDAMNFGTFYCVDCATCASPGAGQCQWCDHASGVFFPADACACGDFDDLAC